MFEGNAEQSKDPWEQRGEAYVRVGPWGVFIRGVMLSVMRVVVMGWRGKEIRVDNRRVAVCALVPMRMVLFGMHVESRQQQRDWQKKGEEASPQER